MPIVCQNTDIYSEFGFDDVRIVSTASVAHWLDEIWDRSEAALKSAVEATGLEHTVNPGEGAFYGPARNCARDARPRLAGGTPRWI